MSPQPPNASSPSGSVGTSGASRPMPPSLRSAFQAPGSGGSSSFVSTGVNNVRQAPSEDQERTRESSCSYHESGNWPVGGGEEGDDRETSPVLSDPSSPDSSKRSNDEQEQEEVLVFQSTHKNGQVQQVSMPALPVPVGGGREVALPLTMRAPLVAQLPLPAV